jgi:hypothetical protein
VIFLQPNFIIAFVCGFVFYGMGKEEQKLGEPDRGMIWAGLSAAASGAVIALAHGGWLSVLGAQLLLFIGIGVYRAIVE